MKVRDLIDQLEEFNQDADVSLQGWGYETGRSTPLTATKEAIIVTYYGAHKGVVLIGEQPCQPVA